MDQVRPGRGSRIARPTERGGGTDGRFDGRTIPLQLGGITALRPRAQRQHDRTRPSQEQEPVTGSDRADGRRIEYCPLPGGRRYRRSATWLTGLAVLVLCTVAYEAGDIGQISGV